MNSEPSRYLLSVQDSTGHQHFQQPLPGPRAVAATFYLWLVEELQPGWELLLVDTALEEEENVIARAKSGAAIEPDLYAQANGW